MEPTAIAAAAISILSPYLTKAGEEVARHAGDVAWQKTSEVYQAIKSQFAKEEDAYPSQTLQRFEASPEKWKGAMEEVLAEILNKDKKFSKSLEVLLNEAEGAGAGVVFNTQVFGGEVGEIININKLEGGLTINKRSQPRKEKRDGNSKTMAGSEQYALLRKNLVAYFGVSELENICFDLGIDNENLESSTKKDLARELINACDRRGIIADLVALCEEQRPHVKAWL